ncbi:MAG: hypothetical protein KAH23_07720 [Kiritimatiellae bacterium]|nr:hypothetical protein [Kiritimatiellia bacterium]
MDEKRTFDFWYAVNNTEIIQMPSRHLETFGTTILNYHLVAELMDSVGQIRVREGRIQASQPQIITPEAYSQTMLEGFGDEAAKYIDWLKQHEAEVRILQYGYQLKQESFSEHLITDTMQAVVEKVRNEVQAKNDPLSAVVVGVDNPWDVCLVKLFWEIVNKSAATNIEQFQKRNIFNQVESRETAVHKNIEAGFLAASRDPSLINKLSAKLQKLGLFEEYQDRFFSLLRSSK